MKKSLSLVLVIVMLAGLILTACGGDSNKDNSQSDSSNVPSTSNTDSNSNSSDNNTSEPSPAAPAGLSVTAVEDTLTIGARGEPTSLDPPSQNDAPSGQVIIQIYDGLVMPDNETGGIKPALAESWEILDTQTVRFHIRQGVKTHNGDEFTAYDVKYSVERGCESAYKQYVWGAFDPEGTTVVDDYTIDIKTKEPSAAFLKLLLDPGAVMVSEKGVDAAGGADGHGRNPIGATGPWKFKEWIAGDRIVLERNEDYWGEKPAFKYLVVRNITDDTSRALSLETGEIDFAFDVQPSQVDSLDRNENVDIIRYPSQSTAYLCFNVAHAPLDDVRVRQALRYALDLPSMVEVAFSGSGTVADGPLTPANVAYAAPADDEVYTYDLDKAKELLTEAGYPDGGFTIKLWTNENQTRIDMTEMIQNAWSQLGVTTDVQIMEFGAMLEKEAAGEHDAFIQGFVAMANDGDFLHDQFYSKYDYQQNRSAYQNEEFDRCVDAARVEFDEDTRQALYAEAQSIVRKDLPWIPLQFGENIFGVRATLTGVEKDSSALPRFNVVHAK